MSVRPLNILRAGRFQEVINLVHDLKDISSQ